MKNRNEKLRKAITTLSLLQSSMMEIYTNKYRITEKLMIYLNIKKSYYFVGYLSETDKKFIITNKKGKKLELLKGDNDNYRDDSYYFYRADALIEMTDLILEV